MLIHRLMRRVLCDADRSKATLPVSLKDVSVAGWLPPDGCVYSVVGNISAIINQLLWIARFQVSLPEKPESVS